MKIKEQQKSKHPTVNANLTYFVNCSCKDYKRRKVDMKVQEKAYEDLKNVFVEQHREVQKRQQVHVKDTYHHVLWL